MAAYAALASLMNIIEQIQNNASHSIFPDKKQIESLREKVVFLQDFVEGNSHGGSKDAEVSESKIAHTAHVAEDVIESHVVDQILAGGTGHGDTSSSFLLDLQKVIQDMDSIKEKVMEVKEKRLLEDDKPTNSVHRLCGLQKVMKNMDSIWKKVIKVNLGKRVSKGLQKAITSDSSGPPTAASVGLDSNLIQLMEWLTGHRSNRQIISIVGMGGIGKTTLARNVYENSLIVQHFDIRAWVTISHSYNVQEILSELLSCCSKEEESQVESTSELDGEIEQEEIGESQVKSLSELDGETEHQLGECLYKSLSGMRYLIIMDDIWSIEVWEKIRLFFPDNGNRSRIAITTRLSNVAIDLSSWCLKMNFLNEDESWNLFCEKAFPQEDCPAELEGIGKRIARNCKGLPLSIVVIRGILRKSYRTQEYWDIVAQDINSILNSGDDEHCLNILSLSYSYLPAHLRPCFLYMGIFPEDCEIQVSRLDKLWVAEGFLKPNEGKSLEDVAEGYLQDLIDRNLILTGRWGPNGKIKTCSIHDTLRELSLKIAQKEKFLCVMRNFDIPRGMSRARHIVFHESIPTKKYHPQVFRALQSAELVRSFPWSWGPLSLKFRLLRVLNAGDRYSMEAIFKLVNLRYLAYTPTSIPIYELPSSISLLWNLQTLIIRESFERIVAPSEIWEMPQLRHLEFDEIWLPDPPMADDFAILGNLQTLQTVVNFKCTEEVPKRIPNIKKLKIKYDDFSGDYESGTCYYLHNLGYFQKLESLRCLFFKPPNRVDLLHSLTFPISLEKLTLKNFNLHWEDLTMLGSLPHLEVLKLKMNSVTGPEWSPVEGGFLRLKYLKIYCSSDLIRWDADNTHFPVLEKLVLDRSYSLKEIPSGIGDIPTLRLIHLRECTYSIVVSAKKILEEQQSLGNEDLQVLVWNWPNSEEIESLATDNLQVETVPVSPDDW